MLLGILYLLVVSMFYWAAFDFADCLAIWYVALVGLLLACFLLLFGDCGLTVGCFYD